MGKAKKVKGTRQAKAEDQPVEVRTFTTPELAKLLNVPLRKAISYIERGYIQATVREAKGHGSQRLFSFADVLSAMVIRVCEEEGLTVQKLRQVAYQLEPYVLEKLPLPEALFLTPGKTSPQVVEKGCDMMSELPKRTEKELAVLAVSVKAIREELLKRMREENMA